MCFKGVNDIVVDAKSVFDLNDDGMTYRISGNDALLVTEWGGCNFDK